MKKFFAMAIFAATTTANAQEVLTGDTRLACEAVLCLSSGTRPAECSPSLSRYFSIVKKKFSDTIRARLNFLNLCPVSNQTPEMQSLVSAISRGAGRCDAAALNSTLQIIVWMGGENNESYVAISNKMPDYCAAYTGHSYTDFNGSGHMPKYVGIPDRGGYWVESKDFERAAAEYKARIEAEDRARYSGGWGL